MKSASKFIALLSVVVFGVSACSQFGPSKARKDINKDLANAESLVGQAKAPKTPSLLPRPTVLYSNDVWLGSKSFVVESGEQLPESLEQSSSFVLNSGGRGLTVREIAYELTSQTQIPIVLDVTNPATLTPTGSDTDATPSFVQPPSSGGSASGELTMPVEWNGSVTGFLNRMSTYFGVSWRYDNGRITLYDTEVRTFSLASLPLTSEYEIALESDEGGGTGGAKLKQDITNTADAEVFEELLEAVNAIITPFGGTASLSRASAILTVVAPSKAMRRVEEYVNNANRILTRQVAVSVKVLSLDLNNATDVGADLNLVLENTLGQAALDISGPAGSVTDSLGGALNFNIINRPANGDFTGWNGTGAVLQALKRTGEVSLITEASVTTLNGQSAPLNVTRQRNFVTSIDSTTDQGVTENSVNTDTLTTGFDMSVLPRVLDDGRILLQYGVSLSEGSINTPDNLPAGQFVQLPDIDVRNFLQSVIMDSGDVLVLAGFQKAEKQRDELGRPFVGALLGGSVSSQDNKQVIVLIISPVVLDTAPKARDLQ